MILHIDLSPAEQAILEDMIRQENGLPVCRPKDVREFVEALLRREIQAQ